MKKIAHIILLFYALFSFRSNTFCQNHQVKLSYSYEKKAKKNYWGGDTYETANVGFALGYSGYKNHTIEMGIGFQPWDVKSGWVGYPFAGFLILHEFDLDLKLTGTSINALYMSGPITIGLNANRYSDSKNVTFGLKPMIGFSYLRIAFMFGYNFFLNKNEIRNFYHPGFTIKYYLPIWFAKPIEENNDISY